MSVNKQFKDTLNSLIEFQKTCVHYINFEKNLYKAKLNDSQTDSNDLTNIYFDIYDGVPEFTDPNTVSQFTCHYDGNDKPVFENDIVSMKLKTAQSFVDLPLSNIPEELNPYVLGQVIYSKERGQFIVLVLDEEIPLENISNSNMSSFFVEGNIFDNRELLEKDWYEGIS